LELEGGERSASRPGRFTDEKQRYQWQILLSHKNRTTMSKYFNNINNNNNNNNSILYFNVLTQKLQQPVTESAQEDKYK
jgi:hypothetical protein